MTEKCQVITETTHDKEHNSKSICATHYAFNSHYVHGTLHTLTDVFVENTLLPYTAGLAVMKNKSVQRF